MELFLKTPTSILYRENERLLKVFNRNVLNDELKSQILFNHNIKHIDNIILPTELYYEDNNLRGYYMPFIKAINIEDFFNEEIFISVETRIKIIKDLSNALKSIHNYLILGDIHLGNILLDKDNGYITDLDYAKPFFKIEEPVSKYYLINKSNVELPNSFNTDINKLFIIILSILFQVNLETFLYGPWHTNEELVRLMMSTCPNSYLCDYACLLKENEDNIDFKNYFDIDSCYDIEKEIQENKNKLIRNLHY